MGQNKNFLVGNGNAVSATRHAEKPAPEFRWQVCVIDILLSWLFKYCMQNNDWAGEAGLLHQIVHSDESSSVCEAFELLNESTRGGGTSRTFKELKQPDQLSSRESEAGSIQQLHQ